MHVVTLFLTRVTMCITFLFQYNSNLTKVNGTGFTLSNYIDVNTRNAVHKSNNIVCINVDWVRNTYSLPTNTVLATLPSGYRPAHDIYRIPCCARNTASGYIEVAFASIYANGTLIIEFMSGTDANTVKNELCLCTSFCVAE